MSQSNEHAFAELLEQLENIRDDKSRLRLVKTWIGDHQLSCSQAVKALKQFFGLGDVVAKAAVAIHPRLEDPENFKAVVLQEAFEFPDERAQIEKELGI